MLCLNIDTIFNRIAFTIAGVIFLLVVRPLPGQNEEAVRKKLAFFESRIRPVLIEHCYKCHSQEFSKQEGGLLLDHRLGMINGGDSGPAIVPGKPEKSLLFKALKYEDYEMPPTGQLSAEVINDFQQWIKSGAEDPRLPQADSLKVPRVNWEEAKKSWSFVSPSKQPLPSVKNRQWPRNRIDFFILDELESRNFAPAPNTPSHQLRRRLSFDLIGLPPDTNSNKSMTALNAWIDHLLASPAFGEKWSRFWLDIARYAEDQAHIVGNNQSLFYPNAYLYRQWVIESMNQDLPYDQFVREQLAVDLIGQAEDRQVDDQDLAALGFLGLGPKYYRRNDATVMADEWEDRIDIVSRGLLGLTVACARCHDHKYDPITTEDYYALAGIFASTEMYNKPLQSRDNDALYPDAKTKKKQPGNSLHILKDRKPRNLNVQLRGDPNSKGPMVARRFLTILDPTQKKFSDSHSGRLDLAVAITNKSNPLFARVIVNRVWGQLIGRPLVSTPSNFGQLGNAPTHPKLLDDLACRFVENGWSLKWLIKEIVSSRTYQQSAFASPDSLQRDPANQWLSRMNRKRLDIEQWRDAILSVSKKIQHEVGGPSMDPSDYLQRRRTIYSRISRFQLNPMLALFDFPDPNTHSAQRARTISPLQKMFALNSPFLLQHAKELSGQLEQELIHFSPERALNRSALLNHEANANRFVALAYERILQRLPSAEETRLATEFLAIGPIPSSNGQPETDEFREQKIALLQTLLISNEFTFVD